MCTVHDLVQCAKLSAPVPNPVREIAAFSATKHELSSGTSSSQLFILRSTAQTITQYTFTKGKSNVSPQWSADGSRLFFLSNRNGPMQVFCMSVDGGEAYQLTNTPVPVVCYKSFVQGAQQMLCVCMEVYPDKTPQQTCEIDQQKEKEASGVLYSSLPVRHWDTWNLYGKRQHLFVCDLRVSDHQFVCGEMTDLMFGLSTDCPPRPFGGEEQFDFSPDGSVCVYAARAPADPSMMWSTSVGIYSVTVNANGQTDTHPATHTLLTAGHEAYQSNPCFSSDGTKIAFLRMSRPKFESDQSRICVYDFTTGTLRDVTATFDISFDGIAWQKVNSERTYTLLSTSEYRGRRRVFTITVTPDDVTLQMLPGGGSRSSPAFTQSGSVLFLESSMLHPNVIKEAPLAAFCSLALHLPIISAGPAPPELQPELPTVVDMNSSHGWGRGLSVEEYYVIGARSECVHCWYLPPPQTHVNTHELQSVPCVCIVHGGPQGAMDDSWHYRWNPYMFQCQGYAVLCVNFHGSTGFGQKFTDDISGDWGGAPFEDIMKAVDETLHMHPYLDPQRLAAAGASYGGYMINWINGHTDRFKCLVNHAGVFSLRSMYFSTEELWFCEWEFGAIPLGQPRDVTNPYDKWDPSSFGHMWRTPTLVVHGGRDYRVPETEGIATFTALQRQGVPSKMLHFPDENHWVLRPKNSIKWHETVFDWLAQWLK